MKDDQKNEYPHVIMKEMQLQLQRYFDTTKNLTTKARSLLLISGIALSILLGSSENKSAEHEYYFCLLLVSSISLLIAIGTTISTLQPQKQYYIIKSMDYYECGKPSDEKIKELCDINEGDAWKMVKHYFKAMTDIEKDNKKYGYALTIGWSFFIIGLGLSIINYIILM